MKRRKTKLSNRKKEVWSISKRSYLLITNRPNRYILYIRHLLVKNYIDSEVSILTIRKPTLA
ncbi:hypothetical protein DW071_18605 [Bacteroides ovatus]|nr:hypothetical protein DW071_18605 [Bacteroides ovatus]